MAAKVIMQDGVEQKQTQFIVFRNIYIASTNYKHLARALVYHKSCSVFHSFFRITHLVHINLYQSITYPTGILRTPIVYFQCSECVFLPRINRDIRPSNGLYRLFFAGLAFVIGVVLFTCLWAWFPHMWARHDQYCLQQSDKHCIPQIGL